MTDGTATPKATNREDTDDRHLALITALLKIFAADHADSPTKPAPQHRR